MHFTIVIPTWNRDDILRDTLTSLQSLSPGDGITWDVIVCDNNSTDQTRQVIDSFTDRLPLTHQFEARTGKAHALLQMIAASQGEWIIFLDDDVRVEPDLLDQYLAAIHQHPDAVFFGGQVLGRLERPIHGRSLYLYETFFWVYSLLVFDAATRIVENGQLPHGPNMAFAKWALEEEGAIDTRVGMFAGQRIAGVDTNMALYQLAKHREGWLIPGPKVHHYVPIIRTGFNRFISWHIGWGWRQVALNGPLPKGRFGWRLYQWRLVARRVLKALGLRLVGKKRQCYEVIASACVDWGKLIASRKLGGADATVATDTSGTNAKRSVPES